MKKQIWIILIVLAMLANCADTWNKARANGGLLTSSSADYIVLSQSGGKIMDVYKVKDTFISSPSTSDGWILTTSDGNSVFLGGDIKFIRINNTNNKLWDKYCEYHIEFDKTDYNDFCHK